MERGVGNSIRVRFDQQVRASGQSLEHIMYTDLIQVPEVGEVVNLKGNPYVVIRRGWAMPEDEEDGDLYTQYAYVAVLPASATIPTPIEIRQDAERETDVDGQETDLAFLHRLADRPSWARDRTRLLRIATLVEGVQRAERTPASVIKEKSQAAGLTPLERRLAATLLSMASDKFSNHGCNDFNLIEDGGIDDPKERRDLCIAMEVSNGDEDQLEHLQGLPVGHSEFDWASDWCLMSYLAERLEVE